MPIELTEDQRQLIDASADRPTRVIDPATRETYVLVPTDVYEELCTFLDGDEKAERAAWLNAARRARQQWLKENPY